MPAIIRRLIAAFACVSLLVACGGGGHSPRAHAAGARQSAGGSVHPPGWGAPVWGKPSHRTLSGGTAEQYDTITLSTLPANPSYLAGYTAGYWPTYLPLVHAYPKAKVKSIAIAAGWHAMCLDVEPGDAVPSQVVAWVRADIAAGFPKPCVYSSLWEFTNQIRPLLAQAGIARSSIWEWDADYIYTSRLDPTFDCTQWTNKALGRNLDESTCSLAFLGVTPPPPPPKRVICLGAHAQHTPACRKIQAQYAHATSAAKSSHAASVGTQQAIDRLAKRKAVFDQRERYFQTQAARLLKAWS